MASLHRVESGAGLEPGGVLDENLDLPKLLLYGSGIYSALTLALHPLSVLKTRAQASTAPSSLSRGDALRAMLRTSGVRGLYAGLGPVILGAVPARAAYISVLEGTRPAARRGAAAAGLSGAAAVSAASGASAFGAVLASQLVYVPVDVVTQKLMVAGDPHAAGAGAGAGEATAAQVVRAILKESGPLGLYRGFGVSLVAHLPGGSIWWASYAGARARLGAAALPALAEQALAAAVAAVAAVAVTAPLDTLKTRVQLGREAILPTARDLLRTSGVGGLWAGAPARTLHLALWGGIMVSVYEELKRRCRRV